MSDPTEFEITPERRSRRGLIIGGAIAVVAALAVGAIIVTQQGPSADAAEASSEPQAGGSITYAVGATTDTLDPSLSPGNSWITGQVVDSLVFQNDDYTFAPWLAKSWDISDDGTEYTFHLRDDVTFSDGTPLNAEAVKVNFDRIANPDTLSSYAKSLLGPYVSTEVVDEFTAKVTLSEPLTSFLQGLSLPYLGIQSPEYLEEAGADTANSVVGSGPYVLADLTPGQSWTLDKRDDYAWAPEPKDHGAAYLDQVTFSYVPESSVRVNGVASGEFDLINNVTYSQYDTLENTDGVTFTDYQPGGVGNGLALNLKSGIFADKNVRTAFQSSFDVETLIDSTFYGAVKAQTGGAFTPNSQYYDAEVGKLYGYDIKKANQLLDDAGWSEKNADGIREKDGKTLTVRLLSFPEPSQDVLNLVQALQQAGLEAGWDIQYEQLDRAIWNERINAGEYDVQIHSYFRAEADIARTVWAQEFVPPWGYSFSWPTDDKLETLLNEGAETPDGDKREQIYHDIQSYVITEGLELPLYPISRPYAYGDDIEGLKLGGAAIPYAYDLWKNADA
ncbi:ABC transporter substrate-binding protein [Leucobacter musarum]|uniref:ABC transporter substrate-binding protein n=1 Tax=Leucobacter musarum TaxID=1930747 RepID=UPI0006A76E81|nr:ABC transporter substrate-binding protein [Leucobacter musarum]